MSEFDEIIEDYFDTVLERNPHVATILGIHEYDSQIPSGTRESVLDEIEDAKDVRHKLRDLDPSFERNLALAAVEYDIFEMDELRQWESNPQATDAVISFIYPLYTRDFAPLEERLIKIADRLEKCPDYIEETKERITDPVEIWVEAEISACDQLPGFFQLLADYAGDMERQDVAYRINVGAEETIDALDDYKEWLSSLDTHDNWAIGEEKLDELLDLRFLPESDEVVEIAKSEIESAEEEMMDVIGSMDVDNPREAIDMIETDHPDTFEEALSEYREQVEKARKFVSENGIATIPEESEIEIEETPGYIRPLVPFSSYFGPVPFDGTYTGKYYFSPPRNTEMLREHNHAEIAGTAVSEVYPGHHLQQLWTAMVISSEVENGNEAAEEDSSLVRALIGRFNSFGDEFIEGWRPYAEETMVKSGYGDEGLRLVRSKNRIQSACRAIVDVRLQKGEMSIEEGADFLINEGGFDPETAAAEVRSYTRDPGYHLSTTVGRRMISALREEAEEAWEGFSEKEFHDTLLKSGSLPVEFHRRVIQEKEQR